MPGVTNTASTHPILQAGVQSGSGSACQPNHYGDFALAPRSPTDLDYMEQNSSLSTHGHAPVVHDRLVTDHHEIHTINVAIKQDGDMQSHVIVDATAEIISRRGDAVCIESANAPSAPSLSSGQRQCGVPLALDGPVERRAFEEGGPVEGGWGF